MKVNGFQAAAIAAGLRYQNRLDLGLIAADEPVAAAGVFTANLVKAAPVLWSREKIALGRARAILVNSGQANACTGEKGLLTAAASARAVARALGCLEDEVLLASTGVIGQEVNLTALEKAVPALATGLEIDGLDQVARAMMTTDTRPKTAEATGYIDGRPFKVAGLAKGAGMIAPNMATMLGFILTDAAADPGFLGRALKRAADASFNRITIDGDTSTNDCLLLLASGRAGHAPIVQENTPAAAEFEKVLARVAGDLARMLVADGEGATKLVAVKVRGAATEAQARTAAMTVANSPLVKTAIFGQDANWGRIMMALGRSGAEFDPDRVDVSVNDAPLVRSGQAAGDEADAARVMRMAEFDLHIDLNAGPSAYEVLTCDFSIDYVKINADYRS
ncbi:MAG: bifunctional glutamate N-acetyltransferase/amino-acid acetyltransferase ArgJ [Thermodesulfobacteriota bacterium]